MTAWGQIAWCAASLWGGGLVFTEPLTHKEGWPRRLAAGALLCLPGAWMLVSEPLWLTVLGEIFSLAALFVCVQMCASLRWPSALYVAVWAQIAAHTGWELCLLIQLLLPASLPAAAVGCAQLAAVLALYLALWATIARWMPTGGSYSIGPRQLSSALVLDVLFLFLFYTLRRLPPDSEWDIALLLQFSQFYCLTVLTLQTELFKKSAMKKELDALNLLHSRQQQQYHMAREHVRTINRICHELKVELAALRKAGAGETDARLQQMETSLRAYDSMFHTGNEVLDTLLTDKSLLCNERGIRLSCVADGARLAILEKADLVTLFENALDNAIEAAEHIPEPERRLVDVQVYVRQQFLMMNFYNPLPAPLRFEEGLPVPTHAEREYRGYGLKSMRHTLQKYGGVLRIDTDGGFFTLRMLVPLPQATA